MDKTLMDLWRKMDEQLRCELDEQPLFLAQLDEHTLELYQTGCISATEALNLIGEQLTDLRLASW